MLDEYRDIISIEELCEILIIGKNSAYKLLNEKRSLHSGSEIDGKSRKQA